VSTYEYKCDACGYMFEKFHSMNDKPITRCLTRGGRVQRLISGRGGIIFKGSGF
jgi:putative FmdB family regulatory protein